MVDFITDSFDIWTTAQAVKTNGNSNGNGAAYGIKKLRELILELAVRGRLVPQNPNDEPASVLLEKIAKEKGRLVKEGKIKKEKPLPEIGEDEKPFALPERWEWVRLGDISVLENGDRSKNYPNKSALVEKGIPFINAGHLQDGRVNMASMNYLSEDSYNLLRSGQVRMGDILYCLRGSLGKTAIVHNMGPGAIASSLVIVRPFSCLFSAFVLYYFGSPFSFNIMRKYDNGTAQPNLSATDLLKFLIPLPPLAEQHRIVAKADELMKLCDQLEQQQTTNSAAHQTLVETVLASLAAAANPAEFGEAWQRIAEHFDTLLTTEQSIDQLKQTILQLAVMGKLVPQDPNDEPASVLLQKIANEKARLAKEGKIKREQPLPEIGEDEKPFKLPAGWEWARWNSVAMKIGDIDHGMPEEVNEGFPYVSPKDFLPNNKIDLEGAKKISVADFARLATKIQPKRGDIVYPRYGTIGENRLVETDRDFLASYSCCVIKVLHGFIDAKYQFIFSVSSLAKNQAMAAENKTTQANVGIKSIQNYLLPLPPLAEQHRIVAKVDELMALCDALKARLKDYQITQIRLADAIVEQATSL